MSPPTAREPKRLPVSLRMYHMYLAGCDGLSVNSTEVGNRTGSQVRKRSIDAELQKPEI